MKMDGLKILLITPTALDYNGKPITRRKLSFPAVTMPTIASLTPKDCTIQLVYETTEEIPYDEPWDIIGLTGMGSGTVRAWQIADEFKKRGSKAAIVLGGFGPSLFDPEISLKHVDSLVIGEAEYSWPKLIKDFKQGKLKRIYYMGPRPNINDVLTPRYDLINTKRTGIFSTLQASRGCPMRCIFCSISAFYQGSYRMRPTKNVIQDIRAAKKAGSRYFAFLDDNIYGNAEYCEELFTALIPEKIIWVSQCSINITKNSELLHLARQSGCRLLSFGLESIEPDSLKGLNKSWNCPEEYKNAFKITRDHGIEVAISMMLGADGDTINTFQKVFDFIVENHIVLPKLYIITPMPGTPFYESMRNADRIIIEDLNKYTGGHMVFKPLNLSPESFEDQYWKLYKKLHSNTNIVRRLCSNKAKLSPTMRLGILLANIHNKRHIMRKIVPGLS